MKLRGKMLLMGLAPILLVVLSTVYIAEQQINNVINSLVEDQLKAVCVMEEGAISLISGNQLRVTEQGNLENGMSVHVTMNTATPDQIKEESNIDISVYFGDTCYMSTIKDTSGERIHGSQADAKVVKAVLEGGKPYFTDNVKINNTTYYAYYIPMYNKTESTPCAMVCTAYKASMVADRIAKVINLLVMVGVVVAIIGAVIIVIASNGIISRITYAVGFISQVADGNLTVAIDNNKAANKDEVAVLLRAVDSLKDKLVVVISQIIANSTEVSQSSAAIGKEAGETSSAVDHVESAVLEIAEGATSQASDTAAATENVINMGVIIEETHDNVASLRAAADNMEQGGNKARQVLKELDAINHQTTASIDVIYEQTNTTNKSANKIYEATNLITDIADETSLLSLNASIEAARAGEAGRGFAVVASQIQKLAEQSNNSAKRIEEIITTLVSDSEKAVETMDSVKSIMAKQSVLVEETGAIFGEVLSGIETQRADLEKISDSTNRLDSARVTVTDIVQSLSAIAEEYAASTEETSAATTQVNASIQSMNSSAEGLQSVAKKLTDSVNIFKVK